MTISVTNSFRTRDKLNVGAQAFDIQRLEILETQGVGTVAKLPFSLRILLENLLRCEDGRFVRADDFKAVPPGTGICHQVNLEYLARVVCAVPSGNRVEAYPDSLVGTDSHTTMVNALGVFGWGVGGIEAEAAMLGQPSSMLIPEVVGFKLRGRLSDGATATDLVLTVTEMLRKKGVVGKFVEFYGSGLSSLSVPDRATIANMAPEYGATMGFFPVDSETLAYLRFTGRSPSSHHTRGPCWRWLLDRG